MLSHTQRDSNQNGRPAVHETLHEAVRGAAERTLAWGSLALLLLSLSDWLGRAWWVFDLATHFHVQYLALTALAWCLVLGCRFGLRTRRWGRTTVVVLGACTVVNLWALYPFYLSGPESAASAASAGGARLRVLCLNVNAANRNVDAVRQVVQSAQADLVFLLEYNAFWQQALAPLEATYPYHRLLPRAGNFGLAAYSRRPWRDCEVFELQEGFAAVAVALDVDDQPWSVYAVHVLPPVSARASAVRNRQLAEFGARVGDVRSPVVVMGDLNCASWSPYFRDLVAQTGLEDSRRGKGVQPTWPVGQRLLEIPIDHCLVAPTVRVLDRRVTAPCGSDHRGVLVELMQCE